MKYPITILTLVFLLAGSIAVLVLQSDIESNAVLIPDTKSYKIPEWVKNNAHWWSEDFLSDAEFSYSLQYLIDEGIIKECQEDCDDKKNS